MATATPRRNRVTGTGPYTSGNPYSCLCWLHPIPRGFPNANQVNNDIRTTPGSSDQVLGGLGHGPLSAMVSFDYALNANMLVGARVGYEFLTVPTGAAFAPVHLEARFTYLIGHDAVNAKLAPMVFAGLGAGEFDAMVPVQVLPTTPAPPRQRQRLAHGRAHLRHDRRRRPLPARQEDLRDRRPQAASRPSAARPASSSASSLSWGSSTASESGVSPRCTWRDHSTPLAPASPAPRRETRSARWGHRSRPPFAWWWPSTSGASSSWDRWG